MASLDSDLFSLRLLLLNPLINSVSNGSAWEGRVYSTFHKIAVAKALYRNGYGCWKEFGRDSLNAQHSCVCRIAGWMLFSLYKADGSSTAMFKKHRAYLSSRINKMETQKNHNELMRRLIQVSDCHGGLLQPDHSLLSSFGDNRAASQLEYSREHVRI